MVTCDEAIEPYNEETKTILTNFYEKKVTCESRNFNILLAFLLIAVAFLIAVSIYCYFIKYRAKKKHLLPFQNSNNKLKQVLY